MADRVEVFRVTVTAGTLKSAPADTALPFNIGIVTDLTIVVPPGCSGLVGFKIRHSTATIIPYQDNTFIITDNEIIEWPLTRAPVGNKWVLRAYNEDVYNHTIELRFMVNETGGVTAPATAPLAIIATAPAEIEPVSEEVA